VSRPIVVAMLIVVLASAAVCPYRSQAQQSEGEEITRRAKSKVQPTYPDLARRMNLTGTARIGVVVAPNGTVREAHIVGGHPVLANAALDAAKKWRFEPAGAESSGVIEFKFDPQH
jgi:TonB family protein